MSSKAKFKENHFFCPVCNISLTHILYGLFRLGSLPDEVQRGEAILGGCMIPTNPPLYFCSNCERSFTAYELPIEFFRTKESQPYTQADFDKYVDKLHSKKPDDVREALQVFERFAVTEAIPEIRANLSTTKYPEPRKSLVLLRKDLVQALWVIGLDEVVFDLIALCKGEHEYVQKEALRGLRFLASEENEVAKKYIEQIDDLTKDEPGKVIYL